MKVSIIGIGMGNPETMTLGAARLIAESDCLIGAQRMLEAVQNTKAVRFASCSAEDITAYLLSHAKYSSVAVLMSGDVGFYSGAKALCDSLSQCSAKADISFECIAGVSCVQYFCAKLCTSWQDIKLLSLHAREQNLCAEVTENRKTFALTGGGNTPQALCKELVSAGLANVMVQVGERLSYHDEKITTGTAVELATQSFAPLAVLLVTNENAVGHYATHGLPDEAFLRGDAPMTKAEVRVVSLSSLNLCISDILWDIGAGTGSVSVEAARVLKNGSVYAIEKEEEAVELLEKNKQSFSATNLHIIKGTAPVALNALPVPNAVFIGGSSGNMADIIRLVLDKNPQVRIVANAITLETLASVTALFKEHKLINQNIVQLTVARAKCVGEAHMMMGQNPVYIISGGGRSDDR